MRVIFIKDLGGTGRVGEIKDIADGYALNFLIPRGFAEQATSEKIAAHEKHRAAKAKEQAVHDAQAAQALRALKGARIEMSARATEKGGLFKAIGTKEIAAAIFSQRGAAISPEAIRTQPIKSVGDHAITLTSPSGEVSTTVVVSAS